MKQLLVPIALLLVAVPALSLEYTDVTNNVAACNSSIPLMTRVTAKGCVPCTTCEGLSDLVCDYDKVSYAHFNFSFVPSEEVSEMDLIITSFYSQTEYGGSVGSTIQYPCHRGLSCPLKAGNTYSFDRSVEITDYYKRYLNRALFRNERKEILACAEYWTTITWK